MKAFYRPGRPRAGTEAAGVTAARAYLLGGSTIDQVAERHGISTRAVAQALRRLRRTAPFWPEDELTC